MILTLITLLLIGWFFKLLLTLPKSYNLPSPPSLPLIGHSHKLLFDKKSVTHAFHDFVVNQTAKFTGLWALYFGTQTYVVIQDEEHIQMVLKDPDGFQKGFEYDYIDYVVQDGLLVSKGDLWKNRRRMINTFFTINRLKEYTETFNDQAKTLMKEIKAGKASNAYTVSSHFVLYTVCKIAFDMIPDLNGEHKDFYEALMRADMLVQERVMNPLYWNDFIYFRTKAGRSFEKMTFHLRGFSTNIASKRLKELASSPDMQPNRTMMDALIMMHLKEGTIDERGIYSELLMMIMAAHDTTSFTLSVVMFMLGCYPEVQEKAREEVESVFAGKSEPYITYEDLDYLKYLDSVINETLRLYPAVTVLPREAMKSFTLGEETFPKGTSVLLNLKSCQRHPRYFEKPDDFLPERFLDINGNYKRIRNFLPFSLGPRNCIGTRFAQNEIKIFLAYILHNFKIIPKGTEKDLAFEINVTTKLAKPIFVELHSL